MVANIVLGWLVDLFGGWGLVGFACFVGVAGLVCDVAGVLLGVFLGDFVSWVGVV